MSKQQVLVATVSMFEPMSGAKGKFTSSVAIFEPNETVGSVMQWAREFADRVGRQLIKVELASNDRGQ